MAQLHATVDEIQLTKRMLTSAENVALTAWTDERYPSAKAVADKILSITPGGGTGSVEYPIGSVIITNSNYTTTDSKHPDNAIGGTWELIDKEYKNVVDNISSGWAGWTMAMIGSTPAGAEPGGWLARADHTLCIKFYLTTKSEIDGSNTSLNHKLGELSRPLSGVSEGGFPLTSHYGMAYAVDTAKNTYIVGYSLDGGGGITVTSIYDKKKLPAQSQIQLHLVLTMSTSTMLDSACDKFYWKRTA